MTEEAAGLPGTIVALLPRRLFRVALESQPGGGAVVAHATDSVRRNFIRLIEGDRVLVKLSPYDVTKGRIVGKITE
ncbi:MAG: translation initiation factor IF-1 [Luteitalea sp.]|nr:translation initiation factor IF-1 [Luteitalea sp.]